MYFDYNIKFMILYLYCSSVGNIIRLLEVQHGLYNIERGRREMGRGTL